MYFSHTFRVRLRQSYFFNHTSLICKNFPPPPEFSFRAREQAKRTNKQSGDVRKNRRNRATREKTDKIERRAKKTDEIKRERASVQLRERVSEQTMDFEAIEWEELSEEEKVEALAFAPRPLPDNLVDAFVDCVRSLEEEEEEKEPPASNFNLG